MYEKSATCIKLFLTNFAHLFWILLIASIELEDTLLQNRFDRMSQIGTFLSYDGTFYYAYNLKDSLFDTAYKDDTNYTISLLKSNMPKETTKEVFEEAILVRVVEDINSLSISWNPPYYKDEERSFYLLSDYKSCMVEIRDSKKLNSRHSRKYYLLNEEIGKQIYGYARKQIKN